MLRWLRTRGVYCQLLRIMITWSLFRLSGFDNVEFTKLKDDWRLRIITAIGEIHKLLLSDNKMYPVSFPCGFLHDIYRKKVVSPDGASPYYLFPGCIVTPDPTVTRYFNGKTKKCMRTSVMTPYKNEPKISSKDFPKVNDPTIPEFMATFSAWTRVPDHWVLRCGSLQIKSEKKNRWIFVHLVLGPRIRRESTVISPRVGIGPWIRRESRVLAPEWG